MIWKFTWLLVAGLEISDRFPRSFVTNLPAENPSYILPMRFESDEQPSKLTYCHRLLFLLIQLVSCLHRYLSHIKMPPEWKILDKKPLPRAYNVYNAKRKALGWERVRSMNRRRSNIYYKFIIKYNAYVPLPGKILYSYNICFEISSLPQSDQASST